MGQLGLPPSPDLVHFPQMVPGVLHPIARVACNGRLTLAVTRLGYLLRMGNMNMLGCAAPLRHLRALCGVL